MPPALAELEISDAHRLARKGLTTLGAGVHDEPAPLRLGCHGRHRVIGARDDGALHLIPAGRRAHESRADHTRIIAGDIRDEQRPRRPLP